MTADAPTYPQIVIHADYGSNAAETIARTTVALRREGVSKDQITAFCDEAKSGDYDHVFDTIERWVTWNE